METKGSEVRRRNYSLKIEKKMKEKITGNAIKKEDNAEKEETKVKVSVLQMDTKKVQRKRKIKRMLFQEQENT